MSRKLKFVFVASLLLNVLLAGVLLGRLGHRFDALSREQRIEDSAAKLPEPGRTQFRRLMESMQKDIEPLRDQLDQARAETIRIWVAEPFDETAYDRQVNKIAELHVQISNRLAENFKRVAKELPAEQRTIVADMFKRPPPPR